MTKMNALLTVLIALCLGIGAGWAFGNAARPAMHMVIGCMMLNEGQKAGFLDDAKSTAVLDRLKESGKLNDREKEAVVNMKTACPKLK